MAATARERVRPCRTCPAEAKARSVLIPSFHALTRAGLTFHFVPRLFAVIKWKESPLFKIVGSVTDMVFLKGSSLSLSHLVLSTAS